ncbi:hypothetical protein Ddc_13199 [Ditylenchus destructor]|nr:hypothetical protein Ddc_13199 [Ditylenchus destructor]
MGDDQPCTSKSVANVETETSKKPVLCDVFVKYGQDSEFQLERIDLNQRIDEFLEKKAFHLGEFHSYRYIAKEGRNDYLLIATKGAIGHLTLDDYNNMLPYVMKRILLMGRHQKQNYFTKAELIKKMNSLLEKNRCYLRHNFETIKEKWLVEKEKNGLVGFFSKTKYSISDTADQLIVSTQHTIEYLHQKRMTFLQYDVNELTFIVFGINSLFDEM